MWSSTTLMKATTWDRRIVSKGIDNRSYYILVPWAPQYYVDFSGCGKEETEA
jgi:pullulanase/glycogen debranching enzyme